MEKLSFYFALWSAKAAQLALRIIRKGGTTDLSRFSLPDRASGDADRRHRY